MERSPMDPCPPHLPEAVVSPPVIYSSVHLNVGRDLELVDKARGAGGRYYRRQRGGKP
jgi:hypothetical protein